MAIDLSSAESKKLREGERLLEQGNPHRNRFYILRRGKLKVTRNSDTLGIISEQNYPIGSLGPTLNLPRSATIVAEEDAVYLEGTGTSDEIYDWLTNSPQHLLNEIKNICNLVDHLNVENKRSFDGFRELKELFEPFLEPLQIMSSEIDHDQHSKLLNVLLDARNRIVNETKKSDEKTLDINVPDDLVTTFEQDDVIFEEGEDGDSIYILLNGDLSVLKASQLVAQLEQPGLMFGEMAALTDGVRNATIRSDTESKVATIPPDRLIEYFDNSPSIARKITDMMLNRYKNAVKLNNDLERFQEAIVKIYSDEKYIEKIEDSSKQILNNLDDADKEEYSDSIQQLENWLEDKPDVPDDLQFV